MLKVTAAEEALEAVLNTTQAVEAALNALDIDAFEEALAARADALRELGAAAARVDASSAGPAVADLARDVLASDGRAREAATRAMEQLRQQMRDVSTVRRGLSGYRGPTFTPPRFADRKG
jgi:hypothetical protein